MTTRFHRAAKDGIIEIIKEATTKDLNNPDDDGLTPTLWAAYYGHLQALQVCCKRGGDPNKCDYTGNSSLHLAAQNGKLQCLSFLVSLPKANLWILDNDFRSPIDIASIRGHDDCVKYLDDIISQQQVKGSKRIEKLKEQAKKDAEKRIKKYEKIMARQEQELEKDEKIRKTSTTELPATLQQKNVKPSSGLMGTLKGWGTVSRKSPVEKTSQKQPMDQRSLSTPSSFTDSAYSTREGGRQSVRGPDVIFRQNEAFQGLQKPTKNEAEREDTNPNITFGTRAFRNNFHSVKAIDAMINLLPKDENITTEDAADAIVPSANRPLFDPDADDVEKRNDDFSDDEVSPLEEFLESLDLGIYYALFEEQRMDMEALAICGSNDLIELGLPLGPRKKILKALEGKPAPEADASSEVTLF